jgi:hypothetical protein
MHEENGISFKLGALTTAVEAMGEKLENIEHKILGNGKIGLIQELRLDVDSLKQQKVERNIKWKLLKWSFHVVALMLAWTWGTLIHIQPAIEGLKAVLRAMGW